MQLHEQVTPIVLITWTSNIYCSGTSKWIPHAKWVKIKINLPRSSIRSNYNKKHIFYNNSSIKNRLETPVSRHFNFHSYQGFHPVRNSILTLIREDPDSIEGEEQRNKWENYWMARLYSYVPKGLNIKD